MKFFLLGAFTLLMIFKGVAQPSLTSSEMLPFGSVMTMKYISNFSVIDTTIKGANAVWDFSTLTGSSTSNLVVTIVNPSTTPYASSFPSSNYAYKESPTTAYRYFNLTSSKLERVGSYSNGVTKTYSDPQVEYVFPLELGVSNLDTWANSQSSFGGKYDLYCLGYGTLKLPGNRTYNNALMVRVDVEEFFSFPVYFWYDSNNGAVLLQYIVGDGFFVGEGGNYLESLTIGTTGTSEAAIVENVKYNTLVEDMLNLSFNCTSSTSIEYSVINSMGREVESGAFPFSNTEQQLLELNASDYNSGMYYLIVRLDQGEQSFKFIKK